MAVNNHMLAKACVVIKSLFMWASILRQGLFIGLVQCGYVIRSYSHLSVTCRKNHAAPPVPERGSEPVWVNTASKFKAAAGPQRALSQPVVDAIRQCAMLMC